MTKQELEKDVKFLTDRLAVPRINGLGFDMHTSSASIINLAYTDADISTFVEPTHVQDYWSCLTVWRDMPEHRKRYNALTAWNRICDLAYKNGWR